MNNEKEIRIKRAMGALENLPKINVSREALDAALEAGEYEEIAAHVARPPEKILSIDAARELVDELKKLRTEVTRLTEWNNNQLETITIQRKIRAYVAFVLAGDELADVRMAADKTMEKLEAAESKLSQLQLSNEEKAKRIAKLQHMGIERGLELRIETILAILNGGQQ